MTHAFGIKCAPTIFHLIMDTMLSDLSYVIAYTDDVTVVSISAENYCIH